MKHLLTAAVLSAMLFVAVVNTTPVQAMRYCPRGGYCLPGTCLKFNPWARVQYACNVAISCRAANCRR